MNSNAAPTRLLLFDGHCNVCDATVQWVLKHDDRAQIRFAPLHGPTATKVLDGAPLPDNLDSIIYVQRVGDHTEILWYTDALLAVAAHLKAPWHWLRLLRWIPAPLRNLGYRMFARVRHRLFGRADSCRLPTPEEASRFLD